MPTGDTPVSQLRRLRGELRQQRDARQLTQKEVAEALDWSPSKLIRIERGPVGISVTDVRALLQHYGVTDISRVEALVDMGARRAAIQASGVGENDLAVATGDDVKEAKNRRAVIGLVP